MRLIKRTHATRSALLTLSGIMLVICAITLNIIFQNGERYYICYVVVGFSGVILIVWNGPKWLREDRTPRN